MNRNQTVILLLVTCVAPTHGDEPRDDPSLVAMQALAKQTQVTLIDGEKKIDTELVRQPVLRYTDPVRGILDGGLWVWTHAGRPVAFQKVEDHKWPDTGKRDWTYCVTTFAEQSVHAKWSDTREYKSKQVARRFQVLSDEPMPGTTARVRAQQLRNVARQFSATCITDPRTNNKAEMRLLPRPIVEYDAPDDRVLGGAVFGLGAFGPNPELLLVIELRRTESDRAEWHFAAGRITTGGIQLRWQGKEVWSDEWVDIYPKPYDTWTFFFAPREGD